MLWVLCSGCGLAQNRSLVADALDWYAVWGAARELPTADQTCKGQFNGGLYELRCDPMSVVVSAGFDGARCSITNMRASAFPDDGLRVTGLESQSPTWKTCGELPVKEGDFEITVMPHSRPVDTALSARARDAALGYLKKTSMRSCAAYFPNIKRGDPFFHVYEVCNGVLTAICEFKIEGEEVAKSPQWTYTGKENSLSAGAGWRLGLTDLWFEVYRPQAAR